MPASLDAADRVAVYRLVNDFLDLVEFVEGPSHTEVMLTSRGPRIIESHNRIGGGSLHTLVLSACGIDLARLAVSVPLGLEALPARPQSVSGAAVRFFQADPGRVVAIVGLEEAMKVIGAQVSELPAIGDVIPPLQSSADRVAGHVIGRGRDAAEAIARCERVLHLVRIQTVPELGHAAGSSA